MSTWLWMGIGSGGQRLLGTPEASERYGERHSEQHSEQTKTMTW